jgi:hypothetical protein
MTGLSTVALMYVLGFATRRRRHGQLFGGVGTALGAAGLAAVVVLLIWLYRRRLR